jgi:hypothetical protein
MISSGNGPPTLDWSKPERTGRSVGGMIVVVAVAVLAAGLFLPHQALWIDETTQLSGLTLSPTRLLHWLAHPASYDFGVPSDRMPPLSYWLGWTWSRLFGLSESSLRWFGVLCTAGATALVYAAGRVAFGARAGMFAALFFALSPNVCGIAVEIRAYPLLLLTTAGALHAWIRILCAQNSPVDRRAWISFGAWLLAGMYTHFFGMLFGGLLVVGLAVERARSRLSLRPLLAIAAILAVGAVGLIPFVVASAGLSGDTARDRVHEVVQLLYRLIGHPAIAVFPAVTVLLFASALVLALVPTVALRGSRRPYRLLALVVLSGLAVSVAANFLLKGFTAAKVSYATWALPCVSLLLAASLGDTTKPWSGLVLATAVVFSICEASGIVQLAVHGDYFAHGPQRHLQRLIDALPRDQVAVVHADPIDSYGFVYFPLRFANGPGLTQFVFSGPDIHPPLGIPLDATTSGWNDQFRDDKFLVVVRSKPQTAQLLAEQIRHGDQSFGDSRLLSLLESSPRWKLRAHELFVSFVAADMVVLERTDARP